MESHYEHSHTFLSFLLLLIGTVIFPTSIQANTWGDLPTRMILVAPQLNIVTQGMAVPRLIHVTFDTKDDIIKFTFRSITVSGDGSAACDPEKKGCLPNIRHTRSVEINQDGKVVMSNLDDGSLETAYYAEIYRLFLLDSVEIRKAGSKWIISDGASYETIWRELSLEKASEAHYFTQYLSIPTRKTGQCVADQLAEIWSKKQHSESEQQLIEAVSIFADSQRIIDKDSTERNDAFPVPFLLDRAAAVMAHNDTKIQNVDDLLKAYPFSEQAGDDVDIAKLLDENFDRLRDASKYFRRLSKLSEINDIKARENIICRDIVELGGA